MFDLLLRRAAQQFGTRDAIVEGERRLSYAELFDRSCRLANALSRAGVPMGGVVASLGQNRLESLEEVTGVALGGFVRSPLYWQDTAERQVWMMERVGAQALIVDEAAWPGLRTALDNAGVKLRCVLIRGAAAAPMAGERYDEVLAASSNDDPGVSVDQDAIYIIRFSAGTTGKPKPIAHSATAYRLANEEVLSRSPGIDEDDSYLAVSPYSHSSGNLVWPMICGGGSHIVVQGFDADKAIRLIEQHRITTLFLVPTMIQRIMSSPLSATADLSSIRRLTYGAAPIPQELIERALSLFGDVLYQIYGQSEVVPLTVLAPRDHRVDSPDAIRRLRSVGRAIGNCFVRIEDPDGNILPAGERGEIVGKSPGTMLEIFGDPDATAERMTPDGWVRTRDAGWLDEDGYLFVSDRIDDMIISGGFNVAPAEIEDALNRHPDVVEAVAFGVPHPEWGATPIAVVRLIESAATTAETLLGWASEALGKVKRPTRIILTSEALPISSAGKLLRREAKAKYGAAPTVSAGPAQTEKAAIPAHESN